MIKKFATVRMILGKDVKKGDKESLQSLFRSEERYRPITVLTNAEEDDILNVKLGGLGSTELKLGDDMEKREVKTIMTLFWFAERAKPVEMKRKAKAGDIVEIEMTLDTAKKA
ncbi:MAG TPA: hypothetical protein VMB24_03360 [Dehalococcoidales bacterium]|nr:hypothetical protein [Dehalococcoidales bacterium]